MNARSPTRRQSLALILIFWLAIFFASLFSPPLLDDADSTHAQAARAILQTGDWVTLHVDGIRYLEKAPLPYWLVAISIKLFGANTFAVHLPFTLSVLALALLAAHWTRRIAGDRNPDRAALYTALAVLTSAGVFLFTRIFIPDSLFSLLLLLAVYAFHRLDEIAGPSHRIAPTGAGHPERSLSPTEDRHPERSDRALASAESKDLQDTPAPPARSQLSATTLHTYLFWTALALAILTKGFVALVFLTTTIALYGILTRANPLRTLIPHPSSLIPVFLAFAIAAPWHILATLRNPATLSTTGHGFAWFYFINEHVLRFLGRRQPRDYNKLPFLLYWSLHIVWLFPWILFSPLAFAHLTTQPVISTEGAHLRRSGERGSHRALFARLGAEIPAFTVLRDRTISAPLLLTLFSATVLIFFSLSTNQEYYTFPAYAPLLVLITVALARAEDDDPSHTLIAAHIAFLVIGLTVAATLACGLWSARGLPFVADIGSLLAHRNVGQYTLSLSHFFDLTGPSFAALRLPASIALIAFTVGPVLALQLRRKRRHLPATLIVAITSAIFLIAAHIALVRFSPMLSSKTFADTVHRLPHDSDVLLFGDQAFGSSLTFYLDRPVTLVDGRSTSMLFGSTFSDVPPIFLSSPQLAARWGHTPRRQILFVPAEQRDAVDRLLGPNKVLLQETSGKALYTDRPVP